MFSRPHIVLAGAAIATLGVVFTWGLPNRKQAPEIAVRDSNGRHKAQDRGPQEPAPKQTRGRRALRTSPQPA